MGIMSPEYTYAFLIRTYHDGEYIYRGVLPMELERLYHQIDISTDPGWDLSTYEKKAS